MGPISNEQRNELVSRSPYQGQYEQLIDRESAYEQLKKRAEQEVQDAAESTANKRIDAKPARRSNRQTATEAMIKSAARSIGSQIGRQLIRGIMGSLLGRKR